MRDANGYKQVRMGADGCGWVRWGTGGMISTKTRQAGGIKGHAGQDLGPMAGEISPDMMFLGVWRKVMCMLANGCRSIRMGANGCMGEEGSKNKTKKASSGRAGDVL